MMHDRRCWCVTRAQSAEQLAKDLTSAHEGLRFNIQCMDHGYLPRFELKARRLVDARPVAQY